MNFAERFKAMVRTATPLVMINTFDPRATLRNVLSIMAATPLKKTPTLSLADEIGLSRWDICTGLLGVNDKGIKQLEEAVQDAEAMKVSTNLYTFLYGVGDQAMRSHFVFVLNAHKFWATAEEIQGIWNLRDKLKNKGSMLILLSAPGASLPAELAQDVMLLEEPLPTDEQIGQIVDTAHKAARKLNPKLPENVEAVVRKQSIAALSGLPMFPAEQSAQMGLDTETGVINVPELWNHKRATIAQRAGLSMYDGVDTLKDMADLDNIVDILRRYDAGPESPNIVLRFDEMEKAFAGSGTDLSGDQTKLTGSILTWFQDKRINGIIFLGVPGCGKSNLLHAWANEAKKPVINVDLPGMQGSLLGESMANLKAAEKTIDAMGGGKVLAIATVNDVSTLPAPLLRRFNIGTYFFDIPETQEARLKILAIHRAKYKINSKDAAPSDMHLWTGSDIENCCKNAYMFGQTLEESSRNIVKVMVARKDEMDALRRGASKRYISASKPGVYTYYDPYKGEAKSDDDTRALRS